MTKKSSALHDSVQQALTEYFAFLDGQKPTRLYELVLTEVETALLETVLHKTKGNQSLAAEVLGINRGTLRKKLQQYKLLDTDRH